MRPINSIVIHCSASPNGDSLFRGTPGTASLRTPVQAIDAWHKARGFHRQPVDRQRFNPSLESIGYHFVIYTNGAVAAGRALEEVGAHVAGFNQKSIGICMVGTDHFTREQWASLAETVRLLLKRFPDSGVVGHRDLSPDKNKNGVVEPFEWLKTCPGFDVAKWRHVGMTAPEANLLEEQA